MIILCNVRTLLLNIHKKKLSLKNLDQKQIFNFFNQFYEITNMLQREAARDRRWNQAVFTMEIEAHDYFAPIPMHGGKMQAK